MRFKRGYPSLHNDPGVVGRTSARRPGDLLGDAALVPGHVTLGVEDFSYMAAHSPGAMFVLGVRGTGAPQRNLHTPDLTWTRTRCRFGAAVLAETALRLLANTA